jgi:uncharacterized protein (TIGR04551 family)
LKKARFTSVTSAALVSVMLIAPRARATGWYEMGQDMAPREKTSIDVSGYLRTRGEALGNLDLDRGLTPSGQPLYPVSVSDPKAQTLTHWDMRLRTDIAVYAPGSMVAVKARLDFLDNLALGSLPADVPSATTSQRSPLDAVKVRRAYGELLLPFGFLAAGRMGTQWGLGMVANGGDCLDCDSADASDRVAFVTPLAGHIFAAAYDFSATGPVTQRALQNRTLDLERDTNVRTATFAFLGWHDDDARARRGRAGKTTVDYGAYLTHRWQTKDIPSTYLASTTAIDPFSNGGAGIMDRGFAATAASGWFRLAFPRARVEGELAYITSTVEQASLLPGVLLKKPVKSNQLGAAFESTFGNADEPFGTGLDAGYASGDPAPGFGAVQKAGAAATRPGDIDGPQANPPRDNRIDNFRFHPDYRVDRILFREIIGTVTDAVYVRPHARLRLAKARSTQLTAHLAGIFSHAVEASSTPSGKGPLGIELDPSVTFETNAFLAALDYAVLFPLAGLDNVQQNLNAKPAQLVRLRLNYLF